MEFSEVFRSLADINGNFILVEFGGFSRLVKSSKLFRCKVNISKNPKLINFSRFPKFQFKVKVTHYRASLYIIRGSK